MRKTAVSVVILLVISLLVLGLFKYYVALGVGKERQQDALAVSEANVSISKDAKERGESATIRADKKKQEAAIKTDKLKGEMSETTSSYDDIPLSNSDIGILCRAYRSTDSVCDTATKSD